MYSIKWSFGGLKRIMKSAQLIVSNFGYLKRVISELNFGVRIFCLSQYVRLQVRFADSIHKLCYFMSNFVFKTFFYWNGGCGCLEFVLCFAADSIDRHFKQQAVRMPECASCHFPIWELPFLIFVPFSLLSSASPNTT